VATLGVAMAMAIPQIGTALIDARADAGTFFSNAWNDNVSFFYPHDASSRDAANTWYRLAVIAGKERPFPRQMGSDSMSPQMGSDSMSLDEQLAFPVSADRV